MVRHSGISLLLSINPQVLVLIKNIKVTHFKIKISARIFDFKQMVVSDKLTN